MSSWREFCSDWWLDKADRLEAEWVDGVPVNWYGSRTVWDCGLFAMDYENAATQRAAMPPEFVAAAGPGPTPTDLNHLFHLFTAGVPTGGPIIEWGGGFGNSARLGAKLADQPYTIVDIPVMSRLQRVFLVRSWAHVGVNLCDHEDPRLTSSLANPSLFLAAFSLDECTTAAHDFLFGCDWYGAEKVVIVAQTHGKEDMFPDAVSLAARLRDAGFVETPALQTYASYFRLDRS